MPASAGSTIKQSMLFHSVSYLFSLFGNVWYLQNCIPIADSLLFCSDVFTFSLSFGYSYSGLSPFLLILSRSNVRPVSFSVV